MTFLGVKESYGIGNVSVLVPLILNLADANGCYGKPIYSHCHPCTIFGFG